MLWSYFPWLLAMVVLLVGSAFFSSSEAALFYLRRPQRRRLAAGNAAQRQVVALLAEPERLLSAVLFWNLTINVTYFTIASIVSLQLEREGLATEAGLFVLASLMVIIVVSEMLPKSLAVLQPAGLATLVVLPLSVAVRVIDPVMPLLQTVNLLSRRLLWPGFRPEPYLRVGDLERAVRLSTGDAALLEQEQYVLESIVSLSEIRADELMRPRTQLQTFSPPVTLDDLHGRIPASGYLLVTEPDSDEIAGAIALRDMSNIPREHLEHHAEPVVYVPWCSRASRTLEQMQRQDRRVAVVINELGETIGVLTFDDILETLFNPLASRTERLLHRRPIWRVDEQTWLVTGMTSVRRLIRHFGVARPESKSVTVGGVIQETLERLAEPGDTGRWGPFEFKVLEVAEHGPALVELRVVSTGEEHAQ